MRKLVFTNETESEELFRTLYAAHVKGPPPQDRKQAYRIHKLTALLESESVEKHEVITGDGRTINVSTRVPKAGGCTLMIEDEEFGDLEAAADAFLKAANRSMTGPILDLIEFMTAAETVKVESPKPSRAKASR
jgi:hypothetical protein